MDLYTGELSDRHIGKEKIILNYKQAPNLNNEIILRYSFPEPWSKLIRRDFMINNNIIFDEIIASNDVMFSIKTGYYMTKFDISTETIYCITRNRGSLTTIKNREICESRLNAFIEQYNFCREKLISEEFNRLFPSTIYY